MRFPKRTIDRLITTAAAISAPVFTFAIDQHWLTSMQATDLAGIIAAAVGSYHTGASVQKRRGDRIAAGSAVADQVQAWTQNVEQARHRWSNAVAAVSPADQLPATDALDLEPLG